MKKFLEKIPNWLKYTLPIFIIFTIILLAYYPGILVSDSMVQWDQVQNHVFTNWHPAYNTIYIYLLTRIWNNPFFVLLVQCFILSLSFGICLSKIEKYYDIKKKYIYISSIIFAIIPLNFNFAITLLKDILYSTFILLLTGEFLSIVNEKDYLNKKINLFKIAFYCLIICLFRHNGIIVVILSLLILIILNYKKISLYIMSLSIIGIYIFATTIGFSLLNITEENYANKYGPISHFMGKLLSEKEKSFTNKDLVELEKYVNIEQLKETFNQYNMDYSINSQNIEYIKNHDKEYIKFAIKKIIENPLIFIDYYLKLDSYLYSPIPYKGSFTVGMFIETDLWLYKEKYSNLEENSKIPILLKPLKFITKAYQYSFIGTITMRPAIYIYSSIIMLYCISKWLKNKKVWLIILPAIFNIISLAPAIPVGMTRYIYSMILAFYIILIIFLTLFIPKIKEKSK